MYVERNNFGEIGWLFCGGNTTVHLVCVCVFFFNLHFTFNYVKIFSFAQECSYCDFISPATMQILSSNF